MQNKTYIFDLHEDHGTWLKALDFYQDEILVFKNRLAEVSAKNSAHDVKHEVEKFENRFFIQKNEIDLLKHYINHSEAELVDEIKANPIASDHRKTEEDLPLRERFEIFEKLFKELKIDFNEFVAKYL
jgi:hypothetical protein